MDPQPTTAELVILGLLAEQPRHGYELEQVIAERGMRAWTDVAFSSIYYVLGRLARAGWVVAVEPDDGADGPRSPRTRRTYRLTQSGETATRAAALAALADVPAVRAPVLVGLSLLPLLGAADAADALRRRLDALHDERARLAAHPQASAGPLFVTGLFDHALALLDADIDWTTRTLARLQTDPSLGDGP